MITPVSHDQPRRSPERRKAARPRVIPDFAADWQRWTPAERVTAGALMAAMWLATSAFYLTKIFH